MTVTWAYIYEHPETDPVMDRRVIDRGGQRTVLVPVPDPAQAAQVAQDLIAEGVTLIELCGGFSLPAAAAVSAAVAGRVPVGHVTFAVDSVRGAADYANGVTPAGAAPGGPATR
ncbi:DUF6506 family protein [Actinoplanes sp. NBC_00393]|uniref:DUF6506 family protein n=1 Tax=Actinoplanes sp. NBC_00393 TaxID=2975953 RepID=UPI002E22AE65